MKTDSDPELVVIRPEMDRRVIKASSALLVALSTALLTSLIWYSLVPIVEGLYGGPSVDSTGRFHVYALRTNKLIRMWGSPTPGYIILWDSHDRTTLKKVFFEDLSAQETEWFDVKVRIGNDLWDLPK